jgi:hypothetical protein
VLKQLIDQAPHAIVVGLSIKGQIDYLFMDAGQLFGEVFEQ